MPALSHTDMRRHDISKNPARAWRHVLLAVLTLTLLAPSAPVPDRDAAKGAAESTRDIMCRRWMGTWHSPLPPAQQSQTHQIKNGTRWVSERHAQRVRWRLTITQDVEHRDLGLHNFDPKFKFGSAEADRRAEKLGYCRVHMPTVPNAGSSWFKLMFEVATGRPTASVWPEGGKRQPQRNYFMNESRCGANKFGGADHMAEVCRNLTFPSQSDTVVVKSHQPFYPSLSLIDPKATCMVVLLVRNPIGNYRTGYDKKQAHPYSFFWAMHNKHWLDETMDIPVFVFRYEDLLRDPHATLERVLRAVPGFTWSQESISRAVEAYKPKSPFKDSCFRHWQYWSYRALSVIEEDLGGSMARFGYRLTKQPLPGPSAPGGGDAPDSRTELSVSMHPEAGRGKTGIRISTGTRPNRMRRRRRADPAEVR